jgi:cell division cycle 2-like protein
VAGRVPLWRREQQRRRRQGRWHGKQLRELFPEELLSEEGFQVLKGFLTCNPNRRLTAAAALKLPWFAEKDNAPVEN